MDERCVIFATKGGPECVLSGVEFLQRFVDHVLPKGFTRIRHYELLAPCHATTALERARVLIAPPPQPATLTPDDTPTSGKGALPTWVERLMALTGIDADRSVRCGTGRLARHPLDCESPGAEPPALRSHPRTSSKNPRDTALSSAAAPAAARAPTADTAPAAACDRTGARRSCTRRPPTGRSRSPDTGCA